MPWHNIRHVYYNDYIGVNVLRTKVSGIRHGRDSVSRDVTATHIALLDGTPNRRRVS